MSGRLTPMRLTFHGRELFVLYQPTTAPSRARTVLMCNPFGQEAIRAHRFYRVLGDRLSGAGFDVVRFDYFGSGDSAGDDEDFDLLGAVGDTQEVADWVRSHSGRSRLSLLGLRLGGSVAMLASARLANPPSHLVLFEPVLDGKRHAEHLVSNNERTLSQIFGSRWKIDARLRNCNLPPNGEHESLGFVLGQALRNQLEEFLPSTRPWLGQCAHALVLARDPLQVAHWPEVAGGNCLIVRESESDIDWATNSAANSAIVPMQWIEKTLECLQKEVAHA